MLKFKRKFVHIYVQCINYEINLEQIMEEILNLHF